MTNAEKYLKDNVSVEEFCMAIRKNDIVKFEPPPSNVAYVDLLCLRGWLEDTTTPTLTEDERVILRNIKNAKKIKRDNEGDLYVHTFNAGAYYITMYNHLFQFIKERRRIRDKGVVRK